MTKHNQLKQLLVTLVLIFHASSAWSASPLVLNAVIEPLNPIPGDFSMNKVVRDGQDVYIPSRCGILYKYSNAKLTTYITGNSTANLRGFKKFSDPDMYVVGEGYDSEHTQGSIPIVMHYDGTRWETMSVDLTGFSDLVGYNFTMYSIGGASPTDLYAVGKVQYAYSGIYPWKGVILHYDGSIWSPVADFPYTPINQYQTLKDIAYVDGKLFVTCDIYTSGYLGSKTWPIGSGNNFVYRYDGNVWTQFPVGISDPNAEINALLAFSETDMFVSQGNGIYRFDGTQFVAMQMDGTEAPIDFWGNAVDDVYSIGPGGEIQHWDGLHWNNIVVSNLSQGYGGHFTGGWGDISTGIFTTTDRYGVLQKYYTENWTILNTFFSKHYLGSAYTNSNYFNFIVATSPSQIYVAGGGDFGGQEKNTIFSYDGTQWTPLMLNGNAIDLSRIPSPPPYGLNSANVQTGIRTKDGTFYLGGNDYGIWGAVKVDNNGAVMELMPAVGTWGSDQPSNPKTFFDIDDVLLAGGHVNNDIPVVHVKSADTWVEMDIDKSYHKVINGLWGNSKTNIYAVGESKDARTTRVLHFDGTQWTAINTYLPSANLRAIWGSDSNNIYAVGNEKSLYHYNGSAWEQLEFNNIDSVVSDITHITGFSDREVFAVTYSAGSSEDGRLYYYNGTAWIPLVKCFQITGVYTDKANKIIYLCGFQGQILKVSITTPCSVVIDSTSATFDSQGGSGVVNVTAAADCDWVASASDPWLTITEGASGTSNGKVVYTVAPNTTHRTRSGTINISGSIFTVNQKPSSTIQSIITILLNAQ
ncbi:MAG: BACON domain-containing protein [Solidesulfovibrio sp. DCME]|uniref:BACON domain-containing protein n=1 Tax=Solidesulfovibrio sp. DCME TaxID=3447380 RepID=UPI003D10C863